MVLVFLTWILIWQKCSQHSGMAAVSKWQALAIHFSLQMCYIFWTSECRVASDLGLCTTAGLIKRILLRTCEIRRILRPKMYWNQKSPLRIGILFTSPEVVHRLRSHSHLYLDIQNTLQIRTGKSKDSARRLPPAAMLERWLHVCRVKITFELLMTNWFISTKISLMKCFTN